MKLSLAYICCHTHGKSFGCPLWQASFLPLVPPFVVAGDGNSEFGPQPVVSYCYTSIPCQLSWLVRG